MTEEELNCGNCWRKEHSYIYPICDFIEDGECINFIDKNKLYLMISDDEIVVEDFRGKRVEMVEEGEGNSKVRILETGELKAIPNRLLLFTEEE